MMVEHVRNQVDPERAQVIVDAYRAALPHLRASPECLSQEMAVCEEKPGAIAVRLTWESMEAHLQGFRRGPHVPPVLALVRPFRPDIAEIQHYRSLAIE